LHRFNQGAPPYVTCWDATISGGSVPTPTPATPAPSNPRTPAPSSERTPAPSNERTPAPSNARTPAPSNARTPAPSNARTPAPTNRNIPSPTNRPVVPPPPPSTPGDDGNRVQILSVPSRITRDRRFNVRLSYNTDDNVARIVVCDLARVDTSGRSVAWRGTGTRRVPLNSRSGILNVNVVPSNPSGNVRVECYMVALSDYLNDPSKASLFEMDRDLSDYIRLA